MVTGMSYYCESCKIHLSCNKALKRHYLSERHKKKENIQDSKHICDCGKSFSCASNLCRHKKACVHVKSKIVKDDTTNCNQIVVDQLIHHNQIMAKQLEILTSKISNILVKGTNNTTNTTTNNIETQNVIVVNSFGSENTEYITDKIVRKLIETPYTSLPMLIEKIHFDPDHPENHNIKVTNKKLNYAEVVKDNKWVTTNKKKAIEDMIENGYNMLGDKYSENIEDINELKQERFGNFQKKYNDEDKDLLRELKEEVNMKVINGSKEIHNK